MFLAVPFNERFFVEDFWARYLGVDEEQARHIQFRCSHFGYLRRQWVDYIWRRGDRLKSSEVLNKQERACGLMKDAELPMEVSSLGPHGNQRGAHERVTPLSCRGSA